MVTQIHTTLCAVVEKKRSFHYFQAFMPAFKGIFFLMYSFLGRILTTQYTEQLHLPNFKINLFLPRPGPEA